MNEHDDPHALDDEMAALDRGANVSGWVSTPEPSRKDDGGPAYPVAAFVDHPVHGRVHRSTLGEELSTGISMRDHFAGQALAGICAHPDTWGQGTAGIAASAYELADAMLKARAAS